MQCPKCKNAMEQVDVAGVEIDRCTSCKGLWFDLNEHDDARAAATELDEGHAEVGKRFNQVEKIKCPCCPDSLMLKMVDAKQPHIWFESCPTCHGRYYDAGEYRDLAKFTLSDVMKFFKRKARS